MMTVWQRRDYCVDPPAPEFYNTTVAAHSKSRQLFEALHPRHQEVVVHLREYANLVAWSQATPHTQRGRKGRRVVPPQDVLQNMFSSEALAAVSACPFPCRWQLVCARIVLVCAAQRSLWCVHVVGAALWSGMHEAEQRALHSL